jgi:hypothetical protein
MFNTIRKTVKALLSDKRGEDLTQVSSGLSKAALGVIAASTIAAVAAGTNALNNTANNTTDTAAKKVSAPIGAQAETTQQSQAPYKM